MPSMGPPVERVFADDRGGGFDVPKPPSEKIEMET